MSSICYYYKSYTAASPEEAISNSNYMNNIKIMYERLLVHDEVAVGLLAL